MTDSSDGLYIMLISVHGLIRGHDLELGRDVDTGGSLPGGFWKGCSIIIFSATWRFPVNKLRPSFSAALC